MNHLFQDGYGSYRHSYILKIFPNSNETANVTVSHLGKWNWPFLDVFLMDRENMTITDLAFGIAFQVKDVHLCLYYAKYLLRDWLSTPGQQVLNSSLL